MNTNTDTDMSLADDFYGDVDLTQEERDMIHEDSLVGRAYDDHQDWKEAEAIREFCAPYVNWLSQEPIIPKGFEDANDSSVLAREYLRALMSDDL